MARAKFTAKHAAVYLRVSSKGQETASQEPDLKRWAVLLGSALRSK